MTFLPAEWHEQEFVQLTWPHAQTDWADILDDVTECYIQMAREISKREKLLIVAPDIDGVRNLLESNGMAHPTYPISYIQMPTNDTWARDHGFITLLEDGKRLFLDFRFNGWGQKFASNLDNQINRHLMEACFAEGQYEDHRVLLFRRRSRRVDPRLCRKGSS